MNVVKSYQKCRSIDRYCLKDYRNCQLAFKVEHTRSSINVDRLLTNYWSIINFCETESESSENYHTGVLDGADDNQGTVLQNTRSMDRLMRNRLINYWLCHFLSDRAENWQRERERFSMMLIMNLVHLDFSIFDRLINIDWSLINYRFSWDWVRIAWQIVIWDFWWLIVITVEFLHHNRSIDPFLSDWAENWQVGTLLIEYWSNTDFWGCPIQKAWKLA